MPSTDDLLVLDWSRVDDEDAPEFTPADRRDDRLGDRLQSLAQCFDLAAERPSRCLFGPARD